MPVSSSALPVNLTLLSCVVWFSRCLARQLEGALQSSPICQSTRSLDVRMILNSQRRYAFRVLETADASTGGRIAILLVPMVCRTSETHRVRRA
ncbi:uncharacterized protein B0H18DRAFT_143624 [Fomitopsis serialis]|uniref:uncharacterized protein n=1 Tax=Fomitopsis serialis TaxID=139415 RepID=UPI0020079CCF|nr:uncharacterized protein B0H18DRAFT_143624 [Neoantrodia serialis]KAH9930224.1 hypothetical protein B0H18DRAFT_143624 [Neoantrodia serialis]